MAMTTGSIAIIPSGTAIAAGGTEAAPVAAGAPASVTTPVADYGNSIAYRLSNNGASPNVGITMVGYAVDGARMHEVGRVTLGTASTDTTSGAWPLPVGFQSATVRAFGNTVASVVAEAYLQRQIP